MLGVTLFSVPAFRLTRKPEYLLTTRDGFLLVTSSWILSAAVGCLPLYLSGAIPSFTDAFFETMSGFTTTGASILTEIESLPKSILFWRSLTHWLGGMGIVADLYCLFPSIIDVTGDKAYQSAAPVIDTIDGDV